MGNVVTYMRSLIQTKDTVQTIFQSMAEIEKESMYLDQLYNLLELETENSNCGIDILEIHEIKLEHLWFKYPNVDKYVLKDINITFNKDNSYALLGINGSGKTTLAKVLMGFYDEYEGKILVDDIDLKDINKKSYMSKISCLFQDFGKYEASVRENISYGNLSILYNDKKLRALCKRFNLSKLIMEKPEGLDMQLGYWFDNGKQISIGQWQKIAICRAFSKPADMYILDEPNAALDAIAESELANMYQRVLKDKVGIIIAHKFSHFIKNVDEIIVLENGKIIEKGDHEALYQKKGVYEKMYLLQ